MNNLVIVLITAMVFIMTPLTCLADNSKSITPMDNNGERLLSIYDQYFQVDKKWMKGQYINWETGVEINLKQPKWATDKATHCSAFVAAVCEQLNIPLRHAPFPLPVSKYKDVYYAGASYAAENMIAIDDLFLANAQGQWLRTIGKMNVQLPQAPNYWLDVTSYDAQSWANKGYVVVAVYEYPTSNSLPDRTQPGHIALIIPNPTINQEFHTDGPQERQAGEINSNSTTVANGFSIHKCWSNADNYTMKFYAYVPPDLSRPSYFAGGIAKRHANH